MQAVTITQITPPELELLIENSLRKIFQEASKQIIDDSAKPMSIEQAADHLNIAKTSVYPLVTAGKLKGFKSGKRWLFYLKDLENYVRGESNTPDPSNYLSKRKMAVK